MSALSIKSIQSTKSLPAWLPVLGLNFSPRLGPESAEGQIQQQNHTAAQTESNLEEPVANPTPCSPTSTESTCLEEDFAATQVAATAPPAMTVPVTKPTRLRRNSFPQLLHKSKDYPKALATLPTPDQKGHPHPLRSAPFEGPALSSNRNEQTKTVSPPPAPTANFFESQLPQVRICIEPSPFSPPPAPTLGFFPVSLPEPVATMGPSPFDPPPAPTLPGFHEEFPASPVHAGPAPIDTTITFLPWRRTQEPDSTMNSPVLPDVRIRSIDPPPAPTQSTFSEEFPASPARSKPAPIDTSSPRETMVSDKGKTLQMKPRAQLAKRFNTGPSISSNNNEPPTSPAAETHVAKPSKVVRFAVIDSPSGNNHFKPPPSPYPWPPRTFGDTAIASILTPIAAEFSPSRPFPKSENPGPTMADALLDRTTPRGRTEQRLEKVGRLTRSASPKNRRIEESRGTAILPNSVFECERDHSYSTRSPIASDKNIILRTYFNPSKAAIHR